MSDTDPPEVGPPRRSPGATRPGRPVALRMADRSMPPVAAAGAVWVGAPRAVVTTAAALALVLSLALAWERWGRRSLDGVLVLTGGLVSSAILLGVVLDRLPNGITRGSWVVGGAVLEVAVIVATRAILLSPVRLPAHLALPRQAGWYVGGIGLVALAFWLSIGSEVHAERAPVAIAVQSQSTTDTTLTVTSGLSAGPFVLIEDHGGLPVVIRGDLTVGPGRSAVIHLPTAAGERLDVRLVSGVASRTQVAKLILQAPAA